MVDEVWAGAAPRALAASTVGEQAQLLQRGDTGVLKVVKIDHRLLKACSPEFLSEFAGRYPKVHVKLVEVLGWPETVAMLEHGEIHLGQNPGASG